MKTARDPLRDWTHPHPTLSLLSPQFPLNQQTINNNEDQAYLPTNHSFFFPIIAKVCPQERWRKESASASVMILGIACPRSRRAPGFASSHLRTERRRSILVLWVLVGVSVDRRVCCCSAALLAWPRASKCMVVVMSSVVVVVAVPSRAKTATAPLSFIRLRRSHRSSLAKTLAKPSLTTQPTTTRDAARHDRSIHEQLFRPPSEGVAQDAHSQLRQSRRLPAVTGGEDEEEPVRCEACDRVSSPEGWSH